MTNEKPSARTDITSVTTKEVVTLLQQGYTYLDVRTEEEYAEGHVPGAFNIPFMFGSNRGMSPNPDFGTIAAKQFSNDKRLIVGCRSGNRSHQATTQLAEAGFTRIVNDQQGFDGCRDAFGSLSPGWSRQQFPVEREVCTTRAYAHLLHRFNQS